MATCRPKVDPKAVA